MPDSGEPLLSVRDVTVRFGGIVALDGVGFDVDAVLVRIGKDLSPGAIVLLHEGGADGRNIEVMKRLLPMLRERGLQAVLPD